MIAVATTIDAKPGHVVSQSPKRKPANVIPELPSEPLGLVKTKPKKSQADPTISKATGPFTNMGDLRDKLLATQSNTLTELPAPHQATSLPLLDRLAARDRAYMLLSGLTKLGSGWNHSEAWFALARAYEESGQPEKARDALWWCVELEDALGARGWGCVSSRGYVL